MVSCGLTFFIWLVKNFSLLPLTVDNQVIYIVLEAKVNFEQSPV